MALNRVVSELRRNFCAKKHNFATCPLPYLTRRQNSIVRENENNVMGYQKVQKGLAIYIRYLRVSVLSGIVTGVACVKSNEQLDTLICT